MHKRSFNTFWIILVVILPVFAFNDPSYQQALTQAEQALDKGECLKAYSFIDLSLEMNEKELIRSLELLQKVSDCHFNSHKIKESKSFLVEIIDHANPAVHQDIYREALFKLGQICSFFSIDEAIPFFVKSEKFENEFGNDSTKIRAVLTLAGGYDVKQDYLNAQAKYMEALEIAPDINSRMHALLGLGGIVRHSHPEQADSFFLVAVSLIDQSNDSMRIASTLSGYGNFLIGQGRQHEATRKIIEANEWLPKSRKYDLARVTNNSNIAGLFIGLQRLDRAEEYIRKAIDIAEKNKYKSRNGRAAGIYGQVLYRQEKYEKSEEEFRKSAEYFKKRKKLPEYLDVLCELGKQKLTLGEIEIAENMFDTANQILLTYKSEIGKERYNGFGADLFIAKGDFKRARPFAEENLRICQQVNNVNCEMAALDQLSEIHKGLGNFEQALDYYTRYRMHSDEIYRSNQNEMIYELESQYKRDEQDQAITLLDAQNETKSVQLSKQKIALIMGGVALGLISILSFFLFRLYQKVNSQKGQLSKALGQKDTLLREIHHRVKNNLQLVSSLLTLQSRSIEDKVAVDAINAGKSRVRSMALIHQDLYNRENLTGIGLKSYLEKLTRELFTTYHVSDKQIDLRMDIQDLELDVDTVVPLGLIINELVTNSLKYAFENDASGTIDITLIETSGELILTVKDSGQGFDYKELQKSTSFGTKLISTLAEQLEGTIERKFNNGAEVILRFTDYKIAA